MTCCCKPEEGAGGRRPFAGRRAPNERGLLILKGPMLGDRLSEFEFHNANLQRSVCDNVSEGFSRFRGNWSCVEGTITDQGLRIA